MDYRPTKNYQNIIFAGEGYAETARAAKLITQNEHILNDNDFNEPYHNARLTNLNHQINRLLNILESPDKCAYMGIENQKDLTLLGDYLLSTVYCEKTEKSINNEDDLVDYSIDDIKSDLRSARDRILVFLKSSYSQQGHKWTVCRRITMTDLNYMIYKILRNKSVLTNDID